MNRSLTLLACLTTAVSLAQVSAAQAPAAAATAPAAAPQAIPAKIALVNFNQVVLASNEGQTVTAATQKKYEPKKTQIEAQAKEVDDLKKSLQAAPATLSDEEKASRLRAIDTKEKALNRDAEDASNAYNADLQEALQKVAQKISVLMNGYAQSNGYTLLLDVSSQQSNVLYALPSTDISQAIVDSYNKQSGIAAPPPSAPRANTPRSTARPSTSH